VTAQRRSESLQAVTRDHRCDRCRHGRGVFTSWHARGAGSRPHFSPFAPGQNIVALRGVSSNDDGAGTDNFRGRVRR